MRVVELERLSKLCAEKDDRFDRDALLYLGTERDTHRGHDASELFGLLRIPGPLSPALRGEAGKGAASATSPRGKPALELRVFHRLLYETHRDPLLQTALLGHEFVIGRPSSEQLDAVAEQMAREETSSVAAAQLQKLQLQQQQQEDQAKSGETEEDKEKKRKRHQLSTPQRRKKALKLWKRLRQADLKQIVAFHAEDDDLSDEMAPPSELLSELVQRALEEEEDKSLHAQLIAVQILLREPETVPVTVPDETLARLRGVRVPPGAGAASTTHEVAALLLQSLSCQAHDFITTQGQKSKAVVFGHPLTFLLLYSLLYRFVAVAAGSVFFAAAARNVLRIISANLYNLACSDIAPASVGLGHNAAPAPQLSAARLLGANSMEDLTALQSGAAPPVAPPVFCNKLGGLIYRVALLEWCETARNDPELVRARASMVNQATLCWTLGVHTFYPQANQLESMLRSLLDSPPAYNPLLIECLAARLSAPKMCDALLGRGGDADDSKPPSEPTEVVDAAGQHGTGQAPPAQHRKGALEWFNVLLDSVQGTASQEYASELYFPDLSLPEHYGLVEETGEALAPAPAAAPAAEPGGTSEAADVATEDEEEMLLQQALRLSLEDSTKDSSPPAAAAETPPPQPETVPLGPVKDAPAPPPSNLFRVRLLRTLQNVLLDLSTGSSDSRAAPGQDEADPLLSLQEARCAETIELFNDGRSGKQKSDKEWGTALSHLAMNSKHRRVYRWSVHLDRCEKGHVFIGVALKSANSSAYLGADKSGWGLIGTKVLWHNRGKLRSYGSGFRTGDTVHCVLDTNQGTLSYACTHHGRRTDWGVAFRGLGDFCSGENSLHPAVALYQKGDGVTLRSSSETDEASAAAAVRFAAGAHGGAELQPPMGESILRYKAQTPQQWCQTRIGAMADLNRAVSTLDAPVPPQALKMLASLLHRLQGLGTAGESPAQEQLLVRMLAPTLSALVLWPQSSVDLASALEVLRGVLQLLELPSFSAHAATEGLVDGAWTLATETPGDDAAYEVTLATSANPFGDNASSRTVVGNHGISGYLGGNRLELVDARAGKPKRFVSLRVMPGGQLMLGRFREADGGVNGKLAGLRNGAAGEHSLVPSCKRLLGLLGGKMAAVLSKQVAMVEQDDSAPELGVDDEKPRDDAEEADYGHLLQSNLLEGGFPQATIDHYLEHRAANLDEAKMLLVLSGYRAAGPQAGPQAGRGAVDDAERPTVARRGSESNLLEDLAGLKDLGLESDKDVDFLQSFITGEGARVDVLDQWMMRFAGKSAFLSVGGKAMRAARLATIAAMIMHTGVLQEARLLWLWLGCTSHDEAFQIKDAEDGAQPSRMLISVWRAAQRVIEWAIRAKQQSGSTYAVLAEKLLAKAQFLLRVRPGTAPVLEFSAPALQKKISSGAIQGEGYDTSLRVDTNFTSDHTGGPFSPGHPHDDGMIDVSLGELVTADFVTKLMAENEGVSAASSPVGPSEPPHALLQVLEQWKRVAKYVTRNNMPVSKSHSKALESVVLFLKGQYSVKKISSLMLQGAWRALQRAAGLNVFAMLVGARNRNKHINAKLFGCASPSVASAQVKATVLEWLAPSLAIRPANPLCVDVGMRFEALAPNGQRSESAGNLRSGADDLGAADGRRGGSGSGRGRFGAGPGGLGGDGSADVRGGGGHDGDGEHGGSKVVDSPQLSALDFVDLGLVPKEKGSVASASQAVDGHYLSNTRGCGRMLQRTVRSAFEQVFSTLAADLERATAGSSADLQLAIIDTWGLALVPDDHEFLSRIGIFRIFHQVLTSARQALAKIEDGTADTASDTDEACSKVARQMTVATQQRVMKATLRVVHHLASQVVLNSGAWTEDISSTTFSLRSPTASLLNTLRKHTKPSGAETLGKSVFEMLFTELETALEGMQSSDASGSGDLLAGSASIDEEEYCFQVVMLLYTISVNGLETCLGYLSTTSRIEVLLCAACSRSARIQHRTLRLLNRLLPSIAEMRSIEDDQPLIERLWALVAQAFPPSYAQSVAEETEEEQAGGAEAAVMLGQVEGDGDEQPQTIAATASRPGLSYSEVVWRACDVVTLLRRLLCNRRWSPSVQHKLRSTLALPPGGDRAHVVDYWVSLCVLGGHFEQLRICGKVRFSPVLLMQMNDSFSDDLKSLTKRAGVLAGLSGPNQESARVLMQDPSSAGPESAVDAAAKRQASASSAQGQGGRESIRLMSATVDVEMLVPVPEVDVSRALRLDQNSASMFARKTSNVVTQVLEKRIEYDARRKELAAAHADDETGTGGDAEVPVTAASEGGADDLGLAQTGEIRTAVRLANELCVAEAQMEIAALKSLVELAKTSVTQDMLKLGVFRPLLELAARFTETAGVRDLGALENWWRALVQEYYEANAEMVAALARKRAAARRKANADPAADGDASEDDGPVRKSGSAGSEKDEDEEDMSPALRTMMELGLGFPQQVCRLALSRCNDDVEAAIEFCLEHAMDMDVLVEAANNQSSKEAGEDAAATRQSVIVDKLVEMGFPEKWCKKAIATVGENFDNALTWILSNGELLQSQDEADQAASEADAASSAEGAHEQEPAQPQIELPPGVGLMTCMSGMEAVCIGDDGTISAKMASNGFPSVGARDLLLTGGCWYFEVTLLTDNCMQIGWADAAFTGNAAEGDGVGDDGRSWSFDGYRQLCWHSRSEPWGRKWKTGDVVCAAIDMDAGDIWFGLNGEYTDGMGCMVRGLKSEKDYIRGLYPAASLNRTERMQFNFGRTRLKFQPPAELGERCQPLANAFLSEHNARSHRWIEQAAPGSTPALHFRAHQVEDCMEEEVPAYSPRLAGERYFISSGGGTTAQVKRSGRGKSPRTHRGHGDAKSKRRCRADDGAAEVFDLSSAPPGEADNRQVCPLGEAINSPKAALGKLREASLTQLECSIVATARAMSCLYARTAVMLVLDKWESLGQPVKEAVRKAIEELGAREGNFVLLRLLKLACGDVADWTELPVADDEGDELHHTVASQGPALGAEMRACVRNVPLLERLHASLSYLLCNLDNMHDSIVHVVSGELARASMRMFAVVDWEARNYTAQAFDEAKKYDMLRVLARARETSAERAKWDGVEEPTLPSVLPPPEARDMAYEDETIAHLPSVSLALWLTLFLLEQDGVSEQVIVDLFSAWNLALHSPGVSLKTIAARQICDLLRRPTGASAEGLCARLLDSVPRERVCRLAERYMERGGTISPVHSRFVQVLVELSTAAQLNPAKRLLEQDPVSAAMADYDDLVGPMPRVLTGRIEQLPIIDLEPRGEGEAPPTLAELVLKHITVGSFVVRGPDWTGADEDGGAGSIGVVASVSADSIQVDWEAFREAIAEPGSVGETGTVVAEDDEDEDEDDDDDAPPTDHEEEEEEEEEDEAEADQQDGNDESGGGETNAEDKSESTKSASAQTPSHEQQDSSCATATDRDSETERTLCRYTKLGTGDGEWEVVPVKLDDETGRVSRLAESELREAAELERRTQALRRQAVGAVSTVPEQNKAQRAQLGDRLRLGASLCLVRENGEAFPPERGTPARGTLDLPEFRAKVAVQGQWMGGPELVLKETGFIRGTNQRGWRSRFGSDEWRAGTEYHLSFDSKGNLFGTFKIELPEVLVPPEVNNIEQRKELAATLLGIERKEAARAAKPGGGGGGSPGRSGASGEGESNRTQRIVIQRGGQERSFAVDISALEELGDADLIEALLRPLRARGMGDSESHARRLTEALGQRRRSDNTSSGASSRSSNLGGGGSGLPIAGRSFGKKVANVSVDGEAAARWKAATRTLQCTLTDGTDVHEVELSSLATVQALLNSANKDLSEGQQAVFLPGSAAALEPSALLGELGDAVESSKVSLAVRTRTPEAGAAEAPAKASEVTESEREPLVVYGDVNMSFQRLFHFQPDCKGSTMLLAEEEHQVTLSQHDMDSRGLAFGDVGFSSGVHYWEVKVENTSQEYGSVFVGVAERPTGVFPAGMQMSFLRRWDKPPAAYGFVNFRATLESHRSQGQGTEQIYGEFYGTGDTVGVCLDMEQGILSFFLDGVKFGQHIMKDLGIAFSGAQLRGKCDARMDTSNPLTLYPVVGMRRSRGSCVSVSTKWMSIPRRSPECLLGDVALVDRLLREHWLPGGPQLAVPEAFLRRAWEHYRRWAGVSGGQFRRYPARARGQVVEVDTSPAACEKASGEHLTLADGRRGMRAGDRVRILQSCGRDLESPEEAVVLGASGGRLWYRVESQQGGGHEGMEEGATSAWYWEPEELGLLEVLEQAPEKSATQTAAGCIESFEAFKALLGDEPWSLAADVQVVQYVNERCIILGIDPVNLPLHELGELTLFLPSKARVAGESGASGAGGEGAAEELTELELRREQVQARASVLRLLNCMIRRALPFVSLDEQDQPRSTTLGWVVGRLRQLLFTWTKKTFWESVLNSTTTSTPLATDEYDDPPQIRMVNVNRIRAAPPKLASIGKVDKRIETSVFGQLYGEVTKWSDQSLRRAYVGKGHGGQKRAFKVKFLGEGVKDYGGPYRAVYEQIADELQNDNEWPDSRMECLLPLFVPSPNRYNSTGDVGRDKFVFNPSRTARSGQSLKRFLFLGKLVGMAVRHGLQMGLDLPTFYWRWLASLQIVGSHLEEIDKVFMNALRVIGELASADVEDRSAEAMAQALGIERMLEVTLSDGSVAPVVPGGSAKPLDFDNARAYVELAQKVRLEESMPELDAFRAGLAAVVPVQLFSLFTERELEVLLCGHSEMDIGLLRQSTEYEGVSASDPHVALFWEVLEEMTAEQRTEFLRFAWARSRMPDSATDMPMNFKITAPTGGAVTSPNDYLPSAQTCFFSLSLPRYTDKETMRAKLLYAIKCTLMDNDFRLMAAEGWADV